jgi:histidinol dehydrogenase
MRVLDLRGQTLNDDLVNSSVPRAPLDIAKAIQEITPLLADVKNTGEQALLDVAAKFGNADPKPFRVEAHELTQALEALEPSLRAAIQESIDRVRKVCQAVMPTETSVELAPGATVRQRWQPVDSVGLYVPGGKAVYPSSVIMNVVPAQVAGVPRLAIATPAQAEFGNRPHPVVLATAAMLGVTEVYNIGGPAAVAAFAYGVPQIPLERVAMVTGPGNIYVAAAKRALRGVIGIDSEAGTTEILIVADESADARLIAFDLVSQAEHDEAAACVLVTASESLVESVLAQLDAVVADTENSARVAAALSGIQSALVLVDSTDAALKFANHYATEHLELHTVDPISDAARVSNAGALFLGKHSPVSLGDYLAGSNHVLPTGEQAKFGSGLGVHTFLRAQQLIEYDAQGLANVADAAREFSNSERLPAHGEAIAARFEN